MERVHQPNVVLILSDDMGFSDIGCFGGEADTPNLDSLFENGLAFTQFYNTARCSPSRASLLTGLHPHQTGVGILTEDHGPEGYTGNLGENGVTMAEVLKLHGYRTYMSGKWHIANNNLKPNGAWPTERGFDHFYGTINGAGSYYMPLTLTRGLDNIEHEAAADDLFYYTDAISKDAANCIYEHVRERPQQPFFQYISYTAPHWPLHAPEDIISKYKGRFDAGWDKLRSQRYEKLLSIGIIDASFGLSERDPQVPPWEQVEHKDWQLRCMEVYAAQLDLMDQGIGRVLEALRQTGQWENTLILFLSDNGGCAEEIKASWARDLIQSRSAAPNTKSGIEVQFGDREDSCPGSEDTYQSYGLGWANVSNTPFRLYKHWVHEGGIATPLLVHWPEGIEDKGSLRHTPAQLPDMMATLLEVTGARYPSEFRGKAILPLEGQSLMPVFERDTERNAPLFWEHEGNAAVRLGPWKLVKKYEGSWELYDMAQDRSELVDISARHPERVRHMIQLYDEWAKRCGVIPREQILDIIKERKS